MTAYVMSMQLKSTTAERILSTALRAGSFKVVKVEATSLVHCVNKLPSIAEPDCLAAYDR